MRRAILGLRPWLFRLFLVLVPLSVVVDIPIWVVFIPLVVAFVVPAPRADDVEPLEVGAPVSGTWVGLNSPATKVPSHGTRHLGQAFAIDILHPTPEGEKTAPGWGLVPPRAEGVGCFGESIHAVAAGTVVRASDGQRDHRLRRSWPAVFYMLVLEAAVRDATSPWRVIGNHVVVELADGRYALFAHLRQGSARVRVGDEVVAGQVLGEVGNSGNTSEPHLHFQLMDDPHPARSAGLPFRWRDVEMVDGDLDRKWGARGKDPGSVDGLPGVGQVFTARVQEPGRTSTRGAR